MGNSKVMSMDRYLFCEINLSIGQGEHSRRVGTLFGTPVCREMVMVINDN